MRVGIERVHDLAGRAAVDVAQGLVRQVHDEEQADGKLRVRRHPAHRRPVDGAHAGGHDLDAVPPGRRASASHYTASSAVRPCILLVRDLAAGLAFEAAGRTRQRGGRSGTGSVNFPASQTGSRIPSRRLCTLSRAFRPPHRMSVTADITCSLIPEASDPHRGQRGSASGTAQTVKVPSASCSAPTTRCPGRPDSAEEADPTVRGHEAS